MHAKLAVNQAYQKPYQLGQQAITIVTFAVMAWLKAVILGQQPLYAVPACILHLLVDKILIHRGNTNIPTCAIDKADQLPHMQN